MTVSRLLRMTAVLATAFLAAAAASAQGTAHLYLIDGVTGAVKTQITKGAWPVRGVVKVDEETRQIWFSASGMSPGRDPYFVSFYRINFDGSGLMAATADADANHVGSVSADQQYIVDTYSRVDTAPLSELRLLSDVILSPCASSRRSVPGCGTQLVSCPSHRYW